MRNQTIGVRAFQKIGLLSKITAEYHHIHEFRRGGDSLDSPSIEANLAEQLEHNIDGGGLTYDYTSKSRKDALNIYSSGQYIKRNSYFGTNKNLNAFGLTYDATINAGAQWIHRFGGKVLPSTFTTGVDYTYNSLEDRMLGYGREINQTTHLTGLYVQNEWSNKSVGILVGGRLDKHSMIKNPIISPRINIRYLPTKSITLRGSYARGYRAPQVYDEDLHVGAVGGEVSLITVSKDLKPEYSNSANLSFDYWNTFGGWQFNFLAEGFFTDLRNVFTLVERGHDSEGNLLLERINSKGAIVGGINGELRVVYKEIINIQMGYTWQQSRYKEPFKWSDDVEPQTKMFASPDNYGYITTDYKPVKGLTLSLNGTYTGKMLIQHYAGIKPKDEEVMTNRFFDLGARVAYDIRATNKATIQLSFAVKNILNQFQKDLDFGIKKDSKYIYGPAAPISFIGGIKFIIIH